MTFTCNVSEQSANPEDVNAIPGECPHDVREFWDNARTAVLFEDQNYGQWGLNVVDPQNALELTARWRSQRERDFVEGDLLIGQFIGDSDVLIVRCDPTSVDYGAVIVALPLDPRSGWIRVADTFGQFLETYTKAGGRKFWERQND
jgi:hypothetical protein